MQSNDQSLTEFLHQDEINENGISSNGSSSSSAALISKYTIDSEKTIHYSEPYHDDTYTYRHVILPKDSNLYAFRRSEFGSRLLSEEEWRALGLIMSPGWKHYANYRPEPEVMLFKRNKHISDA